MVINFNILKCNFFCLKRKKEPFSLDCKGDPLFGDLGPSLRGRFAQDSGGKRSSGMVLRREKIR